MVWQAASRLEWPPERRVALPPARNSARLATPTRRATPLPARSTRHPDCSFVAVGLIRALQTLVNGWVAPIQDRARLMGALSLQFPATPSPRRQDAAGGLPAAESARPANAACSGNKSDHR